MQVFKFGGASVKDAQSIQKVAEIIKSHQNEKTLVVVSAMGKTTDLLVSIVKNFYNGKGDPLNELSSIKQGFEEVLSSLFPAGHAIFDDVFNSFIEAEWILEDPLADSYDYLYDQIVCIGELISSRILAAYLNLNGIKAQWIDARDFIITDDTHREAHVDWEATEQRIKEQIPSLVEQYTLVTQGFIASTTENHTTTLGRDGSDYSAAIFAACQDAAQVTIWKDVPGVLNADPKWFNDTELIEELSYRDAIELTYYGANVIHPKTIKPLQNKQIPLYVKSFLEPQEKGTVIRATKLKLPVPSFIFKVNQILLHIQPKDFSFILEDNLSHIFRLCYEHRTKINMMHNTAINFAISLDDTGENVCNLIETLEKRYCIHTVSDLELITIRYYNQETIDRVLVDKEIIKELKDSYTCQMLVQKKREL